MTTAKTKNRATHTIRVLVAKTSLDGHLRGVATVVHGLRDAGFEVIYGGQITAAEIVKIAIEEDVEVIGLNIGGRLGTVAELMGLLKQEGAHDIVVVAGGPILKEDEEELLELGIARVFPPGSTTEAIAAFLRERCLSPS